MGCMHDFGTPESAWVRKYGAGAQCDGVNCRNDDHYDGAGNHDVALSNRSQGGES